MYSALYKENQLILGAGNTIVVTGWTPKERIKNILYDDSLYSVIGNLYSAERGLNYLLANLLANPGYREIVGINATKEDAIANSMNTLRDFFSGKSPLQQKFLAPCFTEEIINLIRKKFFYTEVQRAEDIFRIIKERDLNHFSVPGFDPIKVELDINSIGEDESNNGFNYPYAIKAPTVADAWVKLLKHIRQYGSYIETGYGGKIQEIIGLSVCVWGEPESGYFPSDDFFPFNKKQLQEYIPQILFEKEEGSSVKYTYGDRIRNWFGFDQIQQVVKKLKSELHAASAVISLWDVNDHNTGGSPCLNHIWFRVIDNKLNVIATFRSNDMYSAWPLNAMGLRALQDYILKLLQDSYPNLSIGTLTTQSNSAHIYDDCFLAADKMIKSSKNISFLDDDYYLIVYENGIKVSWYRKQTDSVIDFTGNPDFILDKVISSNPYLSARHASYLTKEIFRCHREKESYLQR